MAVEHFRGPLTLALRDNAGFNPIEKLFNNSLIGGMQTDDALEREPLLPAESLTKRLEALLAEAKRLQARSRELRAERFVNVGTRPL